jgi:GGDEF domain-containing protein
VLRIKKRLHVFVGMLVSVTVAVLLIRPNIQINYPPEVRTLVQFKAIEATIVVTTIMSSVIWSQLRISYLLTIALQNLVDRDRLTSVATRAFFFRKMEEMPHEVGVSLMADIDHFKQINDSYGHLVSDKVI